MIRAATLALVFIAASTAYGQEFDIFELTDFVDPRVRGAKYHENGIATERPGDRFLMSRLSAGAVYDYYWRTTPTGANVAIFHNVTSYYWGANQLNLKLTRMQTTKDDVLMPEMRGAIQFARYTARSNPLATESGDGESSIILSRYLVGLSIEETPDAIENRDGHRAANYEVAAEVDVRLPLTGVLGTFSYIKRFAGEGESTQRLAYVVHTALPPYRGVHFDMSLAVGAQKTGNWQWGNVRPAGHLRVPLDKVGTVIHIAYAPTMTFEGGFALRHEAAIFLDRTIFARVLSPPATE